MRDLLDSLAGAGQPADGPTRTELANAMRTAQAAYLRAMVGRPHEFDEDVAAQLRTHAGYLDLLAGEVGADQASDAYYVAGTIFEWLGTLAPSRHQASITDELTRGTAGDLWRAALCYSSGRHEAAAAVAASRAAQRIDPQEVEDSLLATAYRGVRVALLVLGRAFDAALTEYLAYAAAVNELKGDAGERRVAHRPSDWSAVGLVGRLAQASATQAIAMRSGSTALATSAASSVVDAVAAGTATPNADVVAMADRMAAAFRSMADRSTFRLLTSAGMATNRASYYATAMPELWTGQVDAIRAGLLESDRSFVLSLPTGSGKSLLAQLRIVTAVDAHPESWVAYVVPTRALTRQAHVQLGRDLRSQGIRVRRIAAQAEAGLFVEEDELSAVVENRTCVVLTPERLDLYIRSNPQLLDSCALVVVDEVHTISEGDRGLRLEALISLIRTRWPDLPFLAMSAFLPETAPLQAWLGTNAGGHRSTWRPTRQLRGLIARYSQRELPDEHVYRVRGRNTVLDPPQPYPLRRRLIDRSAFRLGALLASTAEDITGMQVLAVGRLARGQVWTEIPGGQRPFKTTPITDLAAQTGLALSTHPGLVLLFLSTTVLAESTCRKLAEGLEEVPALAEYADAIADFVGNEHELVGLLRRGCAYHHSRLPDEVLRIVEAAASANLLQVLCATSGLNAGVNLPASIVIVVGDPARRRDPSVRDFSNMAGRAGRPGFDTEGITLYLPASVAWRRHPLEGNERRYLIPEDTDIEVQSELSRVLSELLGGAAETVPLDQLPDVVQQVLLGLVAAELEEQPSIARFLANTYAVPAAQSDRLARHIAQTLALARAANGDFMAAFAETALPYGVCLALRRIAQAENLAIPPDRVEQAVLLSALLYDVEFFRDPADAVLTHIEPAQRRDHLSDAIRAWVTGMSYQDLREVVGGRQPASISKTVKVTGDLGLLYGWGVGALARVLRQSDRGPNLDPMLAYYVKFGVSGPVAAYLRILGVSDRRGSQELSAMYPAERAVDLRSVEEWTQSPEAAAAISELFADQPIMRRSLQGDLGLGDQPLAPVTFLRPSVVPDWLVPGRVVRVVPDEDRSSITDPLTGLTVTSEGRRSGIGAAYRDRNGITRIAIAPPA